VRRESEPKSQRERDRRAEALRIAALPKQPEIDHSHSHARRGANGQLLEEQSEDGTTQHTGINGRGGNSTKKKKSVAYRYKPPARLALLQSQAELVDLDLLKSLERGFTLLNRFKTTSLLFESDAKGQSARDHEENTALMHAASGTRGIGAYARRGSAINFNGVHGISITDASGGVTEGTGGGTKAWDRHTLLEESERIGGSASAALSESATKVYTGGASGMLGVYAPQMPDLSPMFSFAHAPHIDEVRL
jgi:hypothetical protein